LETRLASDERDGRDKKRKAPVQAAPVQAAPVHTPSPLALQFVGPEPLAMFALGLVTTILSAC
jgi:hypothetical protein